MHAPLIPLQCFYCISQLKRDYAKVTKSLDENVGRLMEYLEKSGLKKGCAVIGTSSFYCFYDRATVRPAMTIETIDISLMRMLSEGPLVSLKGSPTVSPTMVAL